MLLCSPDHIFGVQMEQKTNGPRAVKRFSGVPDLGYAVGALVEAEVDPHVPEGSAHGPFEDVVEAFDLVEEADLVR